MIQLSFVIEKRIYQMVVEEPDGEYDTPLSLWEKVYIKQYVMFLPHGWKIAESGEAVFSLLKDANYTLCNGVKDVLLMVRNVAQEKIKTSTVLMKGHLTVGRSRRNDLSYRDGFLSSVHGVFNIEWNGSLVYEDDSTNGTFINGELLHHDRCLLKPGDQIDFLPMLRVIVDTSMLHIRYPEEYGQTTLQTISDEDDGLLHIALYFQTAGSLRHIYINRSTTKKKDFLVQAARQLSKQEADTLLSTIVIGVRSGAELTKSFDQLSLLPHSMVIVF